MERPPLVVPLAPDTLVQGKFSLGIQGYTPLPLTVAPLAAALLHTPRCPRRRPEKACGQEGVQALQHQEQGLPHLSSFLLQGTATT